MRKSKRIISLLFAVLSVLLLLCSCIKSKAKDIIPDPTDSFYVYDEAGVLDESTEEYIVGKNADLYEKCGGQIVVACVNTTGSTDIKDYALAMFNKWGVGSSSRNNGILILLSIDEDDYWVLQGKGLEDLIQSGTLKLMLDTELEPFFAKKQYGYGVVSLFDSLIKEYEQIYNISVTQIDSGSVGAYTPEPDDSAIVASATEPFSFWKLISTVSGIIVAFTVVVIIIVIVISIAITVFIIFASVFGSRGGGSRPFNTSYRGGININPHTFRPHKTFHTGGFNFGGTHHSGGFNFGGSHHSGGSHHGGGFSGGGFSGGSHHSGGGGFSRGGGAGRR